MMKKFTAIYNDQNLIGVRRTEQIEGETVADMLMREGINNCAVFLFHGHPSMQGEESEGAAGTVEEAIEACARLCEKAGAAMAWSVAPNIRNMKKGEKK